MVVQAGLGSDENSIPAGQLNQTHIGLAFGVNVKDGVAYGRIAGFHIDDRTVTLHLDGVTTGLNYAAVHLKPTDPVYFSAYTTDRELQGVLDRILEAVSKK